VPSALVDAYFDQVDNHFSVKRSAASLVRFEEGNLLRGTSAAQGPWDVIFFRNACMYFTVDAARAIVGRLADALIPDGYLFLGHAENLRGISDRFELRHSHDTFYYRHRDAARGRERRAIEPTPARAVADAPPAEAADGDDAAWFHEIGRATERIASIVDGVRPRQAPSGPDRSAAPLALLAEERFSEALDMLGDAVDPDRRQLRAVLLTQLGRFDEARAEAEGLLAADPLHAGAHYLLALADERGGRADSAAWHDEVAAHLDRSFAMPHLHLGILARRRGDGAAAAAHMRQARELLVREDGARLLLFGGGFGRTALLRLCESPGGRTR
jgi:chemotaxis protein methyltransferase CheR